MKKTWVEWIIQAFNELGGKAVYDVLYDRIRDIRTEPFSREWKATVRRTIETHSSDSDNYRENSTDFFYSVGGKGSGYWGIRSHK